jgi:hypothetical protein
MISKHSQTKYFILDPVPVAPVAATFLYTAGTGAMVLATGQAGFYGPTPGSGNHQEVGVAPAGPGSAFQIIQRRDTTNDRSPLYNRPFEQSDWINAFCSEGIIIDQANAAFGSNDSHLIGGINAAAAGAIVPADLTTYQIQVSGHGARTDWFNGGYNTPTISGFYTSPDFSLGTTTAIQQTDIIIAELALAVNDNKSQQMAFTICVDILGTAGGTGAVNIDDLGDGTIAVGTTVTIGYDATGNVHSFVLTQEMAESFAALETRLVALGAVAAASNLVPYVVPGTTNAPAAAVAPVAGSLALGCTMMFVMALDEGQATYDFKMQTKRRIEVGLVSGLDTAAQERISVGSEGQGYGHQLNIQYRMNNRYEETNAARMPYQSYSVDFPNAFLDDAYYDYFTIEHCDSRSASSGMPSVNRSTTIIAVVNTTIGAAATNPYFGVAGAVAQRAYMVLNLNLFNTNNGLNATASGTALV